MQFGRHRKPRMRSAHSTVLCPLAIAMASFLGGCTVYQAPPPQRVYVQPVPAPVYAQPVPTYVEPAPQPVVSIYVEPPIQQPAPILVGWAPPPMLVETVAPLPFAGAVWVGGYWVWEGNWVWAAGRWAPPPQPNYVWVHPYYENRDGAVVFITGHWSPPGVVFVPPAPSLHLTLVTPSAGVSVGLRPIGPPGVFVPAPPGSRLGLIVPAPIGTPPAVVTSAAPVVNVGMRIQNSTRITNTTNVTTVNNITNVTIVAPPSATANGKAFESAVPAQAHLAAALPAVVHVSAPTPVSAKPIPAFASGRPPVALPPAQLARTSAVGQTTGPQQRPAPAPAVPTTAPMLSPNAPAGPAPSPNTAGAYQRTAAVAAPAQPVPVVRTGASSQPNSASGTPAPDNAMQRPKAQVPSTQPAQVAVASREETRARKGHEKKHDEAEKEHQDKR